MRSILYGLLLSPCEHETRDGACAPDLKVGRCVSSLQFSAYLGHAKSDSRKRKSTDPAYMTKCLPCQTCHCTFSNKERGLFFYPWRDVSSDRLNKNKQPHPQNRIDERLQDQKHGPFIHRKVRSIAHCFWFHASSKVITGLVWY